MQQLSEAYLLGSKVAAEMVGNVTPDVLSEVISARQTARRNAAALIQMAQEEGLMPDNVQYEEGKPLPKEMRLRPTKSFNKKAVRAKQKANRKQAKRIRARNRS